MISAIMLAGALLSGVTHTAAGEGTGGAPQDAKAGTPVDENRSVTPSKQSTPPAPITVQITGPDGKPLPPEIQRDIEQSMRRQGIRSGAGDRDPNAVVVNGDRLRGAVAGNIPPDHILGPDDILAYGADSLEALLKDLAPRALGRGDARDTAVLINGKRVSSFADIASLPVEAIQRIDILPEAVAASYGFRGDAKLINVVTFERYVSRSGLAALSMPTGGGHVAESFQPQYLFIKGDTRINLTGRYSTTSRLLDGQRGISDAVDRTLLPGETEWSFSPSVNGSLGSMSFGASGQYGDDRQTSLFGAGLDGPIRQRTLKRTAHLGAILDGRAGRWSWSFTAGANAIDTHTQTFSGGGTAPDGSAKSKDSTGSLDLLVSGKALDLPAGPLYFAARSATSFERLTGTSFDAGGQAHASRRREDLQVNLDVPIIGRAGACEGATGCLFGHITAESEFLSDAGTLWTAGYGLNWVPIGALRFNVAFTHGRRAPGLDRLAAPGVVTPDALVFDATTDETVALTTVSGGNPALRNSGYQSFVAGVLTKPFAAADLTATADIARTRVSNPDLDIAIVSAQLIAAFPDRFVRDPAGNLTRIDLSPVNGLRSGRTDVHASVSFSKALGSAASRAGNTIVRSVPADGDIRNALPPGATIIMADPGSAADALLDDSQSRLYVSGLYTYHVQSDVVLPGGARIDLLRDLPLDGGVESVRHELELQAGLFDRGLGARLTMNWKAPRVIKDAAAGARDLRISSLASIDLNVFANLEQVIHGRAFVGMRVSGAISNLLDARRSVHGGAGAASLLFQAPYLDPLGRVISISLRKAW